LVLFHEFGHFTAAKLMGIKVEEFGFGLPPRAWGKKIGETLYSINWLPIGGFVKLYGEDAEHPEEVTKDRNRAFFAKEPWKRIIVLVAGVTMNFFLGWLLVSFLLTQGLMIPTGKVRIEEIAPNSPAYSANLQTGDVISKIKTPDGSITEIKSNETLVTTVANYLDQELELTILRDEESQIVKIVPRKDHPENEGALGVTISDLEEARYSVFQAPIVGFKHTWLIITSTIAGIKDSLVKVFSNQASQVQVAGIIGIGQIVGEAREFGIFSLLYVVAVLSINLALINLMPFPALDGGRIPFIVYEAITKKRINPQWETYVHQFGMILLLLLMLLITVNDILRIARG
jgi:regulator of sigma E protease